MQTLQITLEVNVVAIAILVPEVENPKLLQNKN